MSIKVMSQEAIKANVVRKAHVLCNDRINHNPNIAIPGILESIRTQLEWLVAFFEGHNNERNKLHELMFSHYAARELDERDDEFINALYKANYVASKTAAGLKIDPKELE